MDYQRPHRRYNPLTGDWVLVSPHRSKRPWMGQKESTHEPVLPQYDPACYLCPGNTRQSGDTNPPYVATFVFENDFPALLPPPTTPMLGRDGNSSLFVAEEVNGICRVVCFSPHHNLSLPEMSVEEITHVVDTWSAQTAELASMGYIQYVQIFENKGEVMGCSQPHPHSQIWATSHVPNEPAKETYQQAKYMAEQGRCLLCDYLLAEGESQTKIIAQNSGFTALVPFWAVWPFEVLVIANHHLSSMPEMDASMRQYLADILKQVTTCYDNLFEVSFPYSMGFHGAPYDAHRHDEWHFHAHFYPPLLRSATIKKFMVGFEMLGMAQRDITPEAAAARLRELPKTHYKKS